ncbi:MAG TPA: hypothetical protein VK440_05615, partial [Burkholderiales bacterium]|nr:hypothetical protein [Burkholderiales bacterium]
EGHKASCAVGPISNKQRATKECAESAPDPVSRSVVPEGVQAAATCDVKRALMLPLPHPKLR